MKFLIIASHEMTDTYVVEAETEEAAIEKVMNAEVPPCEGERMTRHFEIESSKQI
jgi:hypothetical protein